MPLGSRLGTGSGGRILHFDNFLQPLISHMRWNGTPGALLVPTACLGKKRKNQWRRSVPADENQILNDLRLTFSQLISGMELISVLSFDLFGI